MHESRRNFLAMAAAAAMPRPASEIQVPKIKFGNAEISRLIIGCNPFYGYSHFNRTYSTVMREYYSAERVCDVLHQANRFGINAHNMFPGGRGIDDYERFVAEGGKMHLIMQGVGELTDFIKKHKPLSVYHHGGQTDTAFQNGQPEKVRDWTKKMRDLGIMVGVGSHRPEVIERIESEAWDIDFYACCVYNVSRTEDEWRKLLGGELMEMPRDCYVQSDPPRMFKTIRSVAKPCFAFKILAAGRATGDVEERFRRAFASIKPTDGIFVGMFPRATDEVRENAEIAHRVLTGK